MGKYMGEIVARYEYRQRRASASLLESDRRPKLAVILVRREPPLRVPRCRDRQTGTTGKPEGFAFLPTGQAARHS
jgi:hypothetical protein